MTDKQKWIGFVDVKSAPVLFYVQGNSTFRAETQSISFDLARVNEGNAMNLTSGIFTTLRPGIYFFSFTGLTEFQISDADRLRVNLYLNGNQIEKGKTYVFKESNTGTRKGSLMTLQSTLNLKKGDKVSVEIWQWGKYSSIRTYDSINHLTHFKGFMLQEEILASLWGSIFLKMIVNCSEFCFYSVK